MQRLRHPNIVLLIGTSKQANHLLIITELCERGSLHDLYSQEPCPSTIEDHLQFVMRIGLDVARGMAYLHGRRPIVLHRDLKSPNCLVTESLVTKVGDFGMSRVMDTSKTMTGCGTPLWAAPELLMGKRAGPGTDVYAYAVILWEILAWQEVKRR